jgi:hypothetical protein
MHTESNPNVEANSLALFELWIIGALLWLTTHRPKEWRFNPVIVERFSVCKISLAPN